MSLKTIILYACFFAMVILSSVDSQPKATKMVNRDIEEIKLNLRENEVGISFLELSSGESTLIQSSEGTNILINTGAEEAKNELEMHLNIFQIKDIDYLFITNFSEFHSGNIEWLLNNMDVKNIVYASGMDEQIKAVVNGQKVNYLPAKEGSKFVPIPELDFKVLYSEKNTGGMALSILYGDTSLLYMGISDEEVEDSITKKYDLKSHILKVGYFGSDKGTSQAFLESVDPQVAIVFDKREKQPSEDVMERLQAGWIDIFQPNKQGIVLIKCTKNNYDITIIPTREEKSL